MALNLEGMGAFCLRKPGALGVGTLEVMRVSSVSIAENLTTEAAQAFPEAAIGVLQDVDLIDQQSIYEITLQRQSIDTPNLDSIFNQQMATAATVTYPVYKTFTVPASTPFEVTETGLTADQVVEAQILSSVAPGNIQLTQIAVAGVASITATQIAIAANKATVHSSQASQILALFYKKSASLAYRGGTNTPTPLGEIELFFSYKFTRTARRYLWFPRIKRSTGMNISSGTGELDNQYRALLPAGWNVPYMEWTA